MRVLRGSYRLFVVDATCVDVLAVRSFVSNLLINPGQLLERSTPSSSSRFCRRSLDQGKLSVWFAASSVQSESQPSQHPPCHRRYGGDSTFPFRPQIHRARDHSRSDFQRKLSWLAGPSRESARASVALQRLESSEPMQRIEKATRWLGASHHLQRIRQCHGTFADATFTEMVSQQRWIKDFEAVNIQIPGCFESVSTPDWAESRKLVHSQVVRKRRGAPPK